MSDRSLLTDPWGLEGLSVVVMGAGGGGIGTSISRVLGHAGATIVAVDIDAEKLKVCTDALAADGTNHVGLLADGRDKDAVATVVDRASELAPLRGSVQVAGGMWPPQWAPFASDDPAFDDVMALNFGSTVNTVRAVGRALVDRGRSGALVNIATTSAINGMPFGSAYAAAKAAVLSLTRSLAAPTWTRTGFIGALNEAVLERVRSVTPMGRMAEPEEVAAAILFLASPAASMVTGHVLAVDGGFLAQ